MISAHTLLVQSKDITLRLSDNLVVDKRIAQGLGRVCLDVLKESRAPRTDLKYFSMSG